LGLLLIVSFRLIGSIGFFTGHFRQFWNVLTPFLLGGVIAYILNLPCTAIQRLFMRFEGTVLERKSRMFSVLTLMLIMFVMLVFAVSMAIPAISRSITAFTADLENYEYTFRRWIETVQDWNLPDFVPEIDEEMIIGVVSDFIGGLDFDGVISSVLAGFGAAFGVLFTIILAIISSIYFLIEKDRLIGFVKTLTASVFSEKTNGTILKYSRKLNHNFHMYIYTQTIDGIILGSLMTGLLLIFQSPHALLLGITLGVVNYVPYFGSIFGTAFAVVVVAFTQGIPTAAVAGVFMFIIQQIDGNFIQPKLMGGSFALSPLLIIISVTVGMAYGGILGMLIAIPIVAILKDAIDEFIEYRRTKKQEAEIDKI
jgi:predicted PurR-regulated permease PerM